VRRSERRAGVVPRATKPARHAWTRVGWGAAALLLAAFHVVPAEAARYRGPRYLLSGQGAGTWIIKVRPARADGTVRTKIRCRPKRVCGPFGRKLLLDLVPGGATYLFTASFSLDTAPCTLEASVYPDAFEGTYSCSDGDAGTIAGRAS
jgi:hypothetical protein